LGQVKRQLIIWGAIAATTAVLPGLALADNASPDAGGRHGRSHQHGDTKLHVAGRAMSRADKNDSGLEIRGNAGDKATDAGGLVRFAQRSSSGSEGLVGEITCLSRDDAGIVSVTGTIRRGGTHASKGDKKPGTPGMTTADDDAALLDELVPWNADEAAELAADDPAPAPAVPGAPAPGDPNKDPKKRGPRHGGGELAGKDFAFTIDVPGNPQHFSQPKIGDKGTLAACSGGGSSVAVTRGGFRTTQTEGHSAKGDRHRGGHK
jgi:hypothetical protein